MNEALDHAVWIYVLSVGGGWFSERVEGVSVAGGVVVA